jgi:hypothetical protein
MNSKNDLKHFYFQLLLSWLVGLGLGVGMLIVFYGMSMPARPFIYVGF